MRSGRAIIRALVGVERRRWATLAGESCVCMHLSGYDSSPGGLIGDDASTEPGSVAPVTGPMREQINALKGFNGAGARWPR